MVGSPAPKEQPTYVRSTSIPSRSHPTALKIEEELHKLKTTIPSSSSPLTSSDICNGFRVLGEFYESIDDLLHLPSIQQAFIYPNQKKWLEKEMDRSVELLDLCNTIKDVLATVEGKLQNLQSTHRKLAALLKRKCDCICSNKQTQNIVKKSQKALKRMESDCRSWPLICEDSELLMVARAQKEAKEIAISLLCSVLSLVSIQKQKPGASKWFSVAKVMNKRKVSCEEMADDDERELESVSVKYVEAGLASMFRREIQNRASLLNILSL